MISFQAKQGVEYFFITSVQKHFISNETDSCVVTEVDNNEKFFKLEDTHTIMLTISSFSFRLHTIFYISDTPAIAEYFMREGSETLEDIINERGNLCCGAINRKLTSFIPHLGMSTPYKLDPGCRSFLKGMKFEFLKNYLIEINGSIQFKATICMSAYSPINFTVYKDESPMHEDNLGELELF